MVGVRESIGVTVAPALKTKENDMVEYQKVEVQVPLDRVAEFHVMFGQWLADGQISIGAAPRAVDLTAPAVEVVPFTAAPAETIGQWWSKLTERAKSIFKLLAEEPDTIRVGDEIARRCDIPNGAYGVAGALGWPGRHAIAMALELPLQWDSENNAYSMSRDHAEALKRVIG